MKNFLWIVSGLTLFYIGSAIDFQPRWLWLTAGILAGMLIIGKWLEEREEAEYQRKQKAEEAELQKTIRENKILAMQTQQHKELLAALRGESPPPDPWWAESAADREARIAKANPGRKDEIDAIYERLRAEGRAP